MVAQDDLSAPIETPISMPHNGPMQTTKPFVEDSTSSQVGSGPGTTSKEGGGNGIETQVIAAASTQSSAPHTVTEAVTSQVVEATSAAVSTTRKSDGVSKGAVAGIAIGTALLGAAIAFFIAFILFKRRKRPNTPKHMGYESSPEYAALSKSPEPYVQEVPHISAPVATAAVATRRSLDLSDLSSSSDFLAGVLPQTADDRTVRDKVSMLFDQIQQHVENFYRDVHASVTPSMESDLTRFGTKDVNMLELLQSSSIPTVAIKHGLMGYVLNITSPERGDGVTLFPSDVTGVGGQIQFSGTQDLSAAYILYKRLAVHLHSAVHSSAQARLSDIREAAEHFALTFFPWANPTYGDQEKDEDLVQLISSALDLSIWLYGQPYIYEFLWEGVGRRGIVVSPGLIKVSDSKGRIDEQRQVLLEPFVVSN